MNVLPALPETHPTEPEELYVSLPAVQAAAAEDQVPEQQAQVPAAWEFQPAEDAKRKTSL